MSAEFITGFFAQAIRLALLLAAPMLLTGLVVGLLVSLFQTATQINEMTMTFVPKMLAVGVAMLFFMPWMLELLIDFTQNLFVNIPMYVH
jgi:flagellar biosynthetic protein FliQ